MNTHVKVVAVLHIVLGALALIGAVVVLSIFGLTGGIVVSQGERGAAAILGVIALCIGGLILLLSLPGIIGGWGLLVHKSWARVLMIVIGIVDLLNIPFGTALGIYTLWALLGCEEQRCPNREADLRANA